MAAYPHPTVASPDEKDGGKVVGGRVLFVVSEFEDYVRVGGLASVAAALSRALRSFCDIRICIPGYRAVLSKASSMEVVGRCPPLAGLPECDVGLLYTKDGMPVYVLLCHELYNREGSAYSDEQGTDWKDNDIRFARFASAAAAIAAGEVDCGWEADLVHVNDWPAALVPAYLHWNARPLPSILTIHNLAYQGLFLRSTLDRIGAPANSFHVDEIEFHGKVSFLKGGIIHATHVTTVSQTYAREITTPEFGCGLDGLLRLRAERSELTGILNGIDESWNPLTCPDLVNPFEAGDWDGKRCNTVAVRRKFGLALSDGPLFGLVARLVHQKGIDLVLAAAEMIVDAGGQLVVIGTGEPRFERELEETSCRFPRAVGVNIGFDSGDARRIFAGSDFTLVPSRFEPCGLSQMYAQRFGSLPIGLETGGLAETIEDGKTGFLFRNHSVGAFVGALYRALSVFGAKSKLNAMRCAAMTRAFSWEKSVRDYTGVYERARMKCLV